MGILKQIFFAITRLANNGHPDHTTFSIGTLRRSFDSNKGQNVRNDHFAEEGPKKDRNKAVKRGCGHNH